MKAYPKKSVMSIVTGDANYHKNWLARFFHSFPHVDLSFEVTSANFTPESGKYREALGFWAGIPLIWCGILWLFFLVFFCARCCKKSPYKQSCATCSGVCAVLLLFLGCGALVVSFYGNSEAHNGVDGFVDAVNSANKTIERALGVIGILDRITDDTETKGVPALTQAVSGIANFTVRTKIGNFIQQIVSNVNSARSVTVSLREDAQRVNTEEVVDTTQDLEYYRWAGTIIVNCVYIVFVFLTFTALIKKSRWMLILVTVLIIVFMPVIWAVTSFYIFLGIGGGDLCVDPDSFVLSQVNGTVKHDVLEAFIKCTDSAKPFRDEILNAQTEVTQAITALNITVNMSLPFNISDKLSGPVTMLRNNLKFMFGNLSTLTPQIGSCDTIHDEYVTAVKAVCYSALEGVGYLVLFAAVMGMSCVFLVLCSAQVSPHFNRRRRRGRCEDYMRVDDSDPFLPNPPPYERNYGAMGQSPITTESRLHSDAVMVNEEDRPIMNLGPDGESPPPAYQPGHFMQQYYSLAPTPSCVAQSAYTTT